jgi:hypothetical protein
MEHHRDVRIIAVPYDSGHPGLRMGAGPEHLLDNGLGEAVRPEGRRPSVTNVRHEIEPTAEVATAFELQALRGAIYLHKQEGPEPRDATPRPACLRLRDVLRGVDKLAQGGPARFESTAIDCCHEGDELV